MYYIYEITNLINGKTYIGQRRCPKDKTPETDVRYMGSGLLIKRAIKKDGVENFIKRILLSNIETIEETNKWEKYYIKKYKEMGKAEYNISDGGQAPCGEESVKRLSESLKGHKVSDKTKEKMSKRKKGLPSPNKGKRMSDETKKKLSIAHKGKPRKPFDEEVVKRISEKLKGHKVSDETRKKISEKTKEKMNTDEIRNKIKEANKIRFSKEEERKKLSIAHKGKVLSEEHKRKISESLKRRYNNGLH